jgi:hypothetical protein
MEYQVWNRGKLIEEIKKEGREKVKRANQDSFGNWPLIQSFSDEMLNNKLDSQLRDLYVNFKKDNDPKFKEEYEVTQERKRFFNQPECDADYDYWVKQGYWTIDEAVALLLGKDPRKVTWESVKSYITKSSLADKFNELRELAIRHAEFKQLFDKSLPGVVLAWATRLGISIPASLKEASDALGIQVADWKSLYDNKEMQYKALEKLYLEKNSNQVTLTNLPEKTDQDDLGERERSSLYMLIATMAYDGYGYQPGQNSPLHAELSRAVALFIGQNISDDTVRKWLGRATNRFPKIGKTE